MGLTKMTDSVGTGHAACRGMVSGDSQSTAWRDVGPRRSESVLRQHPASDGRESQEDRALRNVDAMLRALEEDYRRTLSLGGEIQSGEEQVTTPAGEISRGIPGRSPRDEDVSDSLPRSGERKLPRRPFSNRRETVNEQELQEEQREQVTYPPSAEDRGVEPGSRVAAACSNGVLLSKSTDAQSREKCACVLALPRDGQETQTHRHSWLSEVDQVERERRDDSFRLSTGEESDRKGDLERNCYQSLPSSPSGCESSSPRSESEEETDETPAFYQPFSSQAASRCGASSENTTTRWDCRFDSSGFENADRRTGDWPDAKAFVRVSATSAVDIHLEEDATESRSSVSPSRVASTSDRCAYNLSRGCRYPLKSRTNGRKERRAFLSPEPRQSHEAPSHQRNVMDHASDAFGSSPALRLPSSGAALDCRDGALEPGENEDFPVAVWNAGVCVIVPAAIAGDEASAKPREIRAPSKGDASAAADSTNRTGVVAPSGKKAAAWNVRIRPRLAVPEDVKTQGARNTLHHRGGVSEEAASGGRNGGTADVVGPVSRTSPGVRSENGRLPEEIRDREESDLEIIRTTMERLILPRPFWMVEEGSVSPLHS